MIKYTKYISLEIKLVYTRAADVENSFKNSEN